MTRDELVELGVLELVDRVLALERENERLKAEHRGFRVQPDDPAAESPRPETRGAASSSG